MSRFSASFPLWSVPLFALAWCTIITKIAEGLADFSTDSDTLGDAYEYLIGQFAAGSGKKAGEFYTPQQISSILSGIVTLEHNKFLKELGLPPLP